MPRLIVCKYCGKIHQNNFDCGKKPQYKKDKDNKVNRFHSSYSWTKKAKEIRSRDIVCRLCLDEKKIEPNELSVHHIIPLSKEEGWKARLESWNLLTLCSRHHEEAENGRITKEKLFSLVPPGDQS